MDDIARDVIECRVEADPDRAPERRPRYPRCGRSVRRVDSERSAHRVTTFGRVGYRRAHARCHACGAASSLSGDCVGLRCQALSEDGRWDDYYIRLREGLIEIPTRERTKPLPVFARRDPQPLKIPA